MRLAASQYEDLVPLDDFQLDLQLADHASSIESEEVLREYHVVANSRGDTVKVQKVNTMLTTYTLRAQELREMIGDRLMASVLMSFTFSPEDRDKFVNLLVSLLPGVHAGEDTRLHSICMGDVSRRTVNFFSRIAVTDKTYWEKCTKDLSIKKLQDHAGVLYAFIMRSVMALLRPAFIVSTKEGVWMLRTSDSVFAICNKPLDNIRPINPRQDLFVGRYKHHEVLEWEKGVDDPNLLEIGDMMDAKRNCLIRAAHDIKISQTTCEQFLNDSYPLCVKTMKALRGR